MKNLKWKLLSSTYLFKDLWFTVRKDTCLTPDGKVISPYYVYEFPTWVTALPVTRDGRIIMVRQYRHALGEVCLEIPGGCMDPSDKDTQAAVSRELLEETGYVFDEFLPLGKISANPSTNNNLMYMYLATGGEKVAEQQLDGAEELEVELFTVAEVKELISQNRILQAMHVACLVYGLQKLGEIDFR
ncbi:MAG TPA: NUDIX hydrolase [Chitinophagaceae bacterium]|nr:NUDIX hydrolase [Chitinophagaceae bacterium]